MSIDKMKSTTFERVDYETWAETAVKSLRGKPLEDLVTKTAEDIDIQPLYTKEQLEAFTYEDSLNSIRQGQTSALWTVAQRQFATTSEAFLNDLEDTLSRGNEAIVYDGNNPIAWKEEDLEKLVTLMKTVPIYAINIKEEDALLTAIKQLPLEEQKLINGYLLGESLDIPKGYTNLRTISANMVQAHSEGADSVTELALALAQASEKATTYEEFSEFEDKFFVRFAIDTHFFMEIAKLRAFRALWQTFRSAYGKTDNKTVPILSENSLRSYSKLDPYVNLLRAGNEALSAVLGGTDLLTVYPHDILTGVTPTSIRLARNVQLVIKEETLVDKVIDPAGGSYFIEILTNQLIKDAWALFQEIEAQGGYTTYISKGRLDDRLEQLREDRHDQIAHGKKSLIGTNIYADLENKIVHTDNLADRIDVEHRFSQAYEDLREYYGNNSQPRIVLLTFGELKDFKPRADFVGGFLATGGLESEWSPAFATVAEAHEWMKEESVDYGIVCASAQETTEVMDEFLNGLSKNVLLDVAGSHDKELEEKWFANGLHGSIHNGQNNVEKLQNLTDWWKGAKQA